MHCLLGEYFFWWAYSVLPISSDKFSFEVYFFQILILKWLHQLVSLVHLLKLSFSILLLWGRIAPLMLGCVSWVLQKNGSCFGIHSVSLCLFIWTLRQLMLRDINEQCLLIPDTFCCVFPLFWLAGLWLFISYFFWVLLTSSVVRLEFSF